MLVSSWSLRHCRLPLKFKVTVGFGDQRNTGTVFDASKCEVQKHFRRRSQIYYIGFDRFCDSIRMKHTILLLIYIGLFNNGTAFHQDVQLNRCVHLPFWIQKRQFLSGETSSYSESLTQNDMGVQIFDHFARSI